MPGIGIITNPYSKLNKRNPDRIHLLGYILGEKGVFEITQSLDHLSEVAQKFKENKIEILAINGGDGTISRTITAFKKAYGDEPLPKVALLKGGTMNVLALNLGIRGNPEKILSILLELASSDQPLPTVKLPSLVVEDNYGFVYADGTITHLLEEFYKRKSGIVGALWLGLRLIGSALIKGELFKQIVRERTIELTGPKDKAHRHNTLGVLAATIKRLPLNIPFFGQMSIRRPTAFQTVSVTCKPEKLLWQLPGIVLQNKKTQSLGKIGFCGDVAKIHSKSRITYTLDGEIYSAKSSLLELRLGPVIEFIRL